MSKVAAAKKQYIKCKLAQGKPTACVGKSGVSEDLLEEIEKQLKRQEMVKVRILKTALVHENAKQIAMRISQQTEATLVEVRGHTFLLYKPDKK